MYIHFQLLSRGYFNSTSNHFRVLSLCLASSLAAGVSSSFLSSSSSSSTSSSVETCSPAIELPSCAGESCVGGIVVEVLVVGKADEEVFCFFFFLRISARFAASSLA